MLFFWSDELFDSTNSEASTFEEGIVRREGIQVLSEGKPSECLRFINENKRCLKFT